MRILNVEDNAFKYVKICKELYNLGIAKEDIVWARSQSEAFQIINQSEKENVPFDLFIIDTDYPIGTLEVKRTGNAGELFIKEIQQRENIVPIILCSSVRYQYPDIFGNIYYSDNSDWEDDLKKYILILKSKGV